MIFCSIFRIIARFLSLLLFRCYEAPPYEGLSVCPSGRPSVYSFIRPSVDPSVRRSITPSLLRRKKVFRSTLCRVSGLVVEKLKEMVVVLKLLVYIVVITSFKVLKKLSNDKKGLFFQKTVVEVSQK